MTIWERVYPHVKDGLAPETNIIAFSKELGNKLQLNPNSIRDSLYRNFKFRKKVSRRAKAIELFSEGKNPKQVQAELGGALKYYRNCYYEWRERRVRPKHKLNVLESLRLEAENRGMTIPELKVALLTKIVERELFDDILGKVRK